MRLLLLTAFALAACTQHTEEVTAPHHVTKVNGGQDMPIEKHAGPPVPAAFVGQQHKDPVCKMMIAVTPDSIWAEHAGKHYFFCSKDCKELFIEDTANYIKDTK